MDMAKGRLMRSRLLFILILISSITYSQYAQQAKIVASDAAASDHFGYSYLGIDGDYAVIGAHQNDDGGSNSGSAYIFTRSGTSWSQQAKLVASDAAAGDYFGMRYRLPGLEERAPFGQGGFLGNDSICLSKHSLVYEFFRSGGHVQSTSDSLLLPNWRFTDFITDCWRAIQSGTPGTFDPSDFNEPTTGTRCGFSHPRA